MSPEGLLYVMAVPVVWVVFFAVKNFRARQFVMVLTSLLLYASWGLKFLGVLLFSSLLNYTLGFWLRRRPSAGRLWVGIILNVALLSTFKYLPGWSLLLPRTFLSALLVRLVLPVGISFWTFQALSYLFDLYRGDDLDPSLLEFLLYMSFWPTVLSGPICRLSSLLPQFRKFTNPEAEDIRRGLDRICMGLIMTGLAQALAGGSCPGQGLDDAFDRVSRGWTGLDVWCLTIGYGFELFFDFAGYSHIVIGAARLFGIRLDENFSRPYLSITPSEFWARWHMSLSFWIRDYLFLPFVMLRREKWWRNVALVVSMVVFGLWHRGTLLFALWGVYQGLLLVVHRGWQQLQRRFGWQLPRFITAPCSWVITFGAICLGWVLFRANTTSQALTLLRAVVAPTAWMNHVLPLSLYFAVVACTLGYFATVGTVELWRKYAAARAVPMELRLAAYAVAVYLGILHMAHTQAFIYTQF